MKVSDWSQSHKWVQQSLSFQYCALLDYWSPVSRDRSSNQTKRSVKSHFSLSINVCRTFLTSCKSTLTLWDYRMLLLVLYLSQQTFMWHWVQVSRSWFPPFFELGRSTKLPTRFATFALLWKSKPHLECITRKQHFLVVIITWLVTVYIFHILHIYYIIMIICYYM